MNSDNTTIYDLIAKSFSDQLTEAEAVQLQQWTEEDERNMDEYTDLKEIWNRSNRLALSRKSNLQRSLKMTREKAGIDKSPDKRWIGYIAHAAAVLLVALLIAPLYNLFLPQKTVSLPVVYQEVKATYGTQSRIELADGSVVVLNSGSSLRFPASFEGAGTRTVELRGEGHFTVARNSGQPFIVDVNKMQVKVLGTTFNVDAYPDQESIVVALVEGKICLQQKTKEGEVDLLQMGSNQVATYKEGERRLRWKEERDLTKYIAWTEGKIVFNDDPVQTVIQKLESWYNVDIELADQNMEKYRFTGTFIDEPLEQVLSILNMTSKMSYTIVPAVKQMDESYSKRKIILRSKQ